MLADTWEEEARDAGLRPGQTSIVTKEIIPLRFVRRPLTLPGGMFGLLFDLGYRQVRPHSPLGAFNAGSGYGVDDNTEVGIMLVIASFSSEPDAGFRSPRIFGKYRLLSGDFELAARLDIELPLGEGWLGQAHLPMLARIADVIRIDAAPGVELTTNPGVQFVVKLPLQLGFQIIDALRLSVGGQLQLERFGNERLLGNLSASATYAVGGASGAFGDISLEVTTPNLALYGALPEDPNIGNYWSVFLNTRFYIAQDPEYGRIENL